MKSKSEPLGSMPTVRPPTKRITNSFLQTEQPTHPAAVRHARGTQPAVCRQKPRPIADATASISTHAAPRRQWLPQILDHTKAPGIGGPGRFHQRDQAHGIVQEARRQAECAQSALGLVCIDQGDGCGVLVLSSAPPVLTCLTSPLPPNPPRSLLVG